MKIPAPLTYAWTIPASIFLVLWSLERSYTFTLPLDVMKGFNDRLFIPKHANGSAPTELSDSFHQAYVMFDDVETTLRYYSVRLHIAVSVVMGFCVLWNLWHGQQIAKLRAMGLRAHPDLKLHKLVGKIFLYCYVVNQAVMAYTLFWIGMVPLGIEFTVINTISFWILMVSVPLAIRHAQQNRIAAHRACMIWAAGGLFVNPAQRFIWIVGCKILSAEHFRDFGDFVVFLKYAEYGGFAACVLAALIYASTGEAVIVKKKAKTA